VAGTVTLLCAVGTAAQATNPIVSAILANDTIRVGEVFTLELHVDLPSTAVVRFPAVLPLPEDIEQREAVEVRSGDDDRSWSARYALLAWSSDSLSIPPVLATVAPAAAAEFEITIVPPPIAVSSVLPTDDAGLELRDARPYLRVQGFPWWILFLIAAAIATAWYLLRRRRGPEVVFAPTGPGDLAIHELEKLREEWRAGGLSVGAFYDRYETTLRRYARTTRSWAPSRTLIGLTRTGELFSALRRSLFVRFAHADAAKDAPESAIEAGESFVRSEMPRDEEADADGVDGTELDVVEEVAS
jgi:hypothetical protein